MYFCTTWWVLCSGTDFSDYWLFNHLVLDSLDRILTLSVKVLKIMSKSWLTKTYSFCITMIWCIYNDEWLAIEQLKYNYLTSLIFILVSSTSSYTCYQISTAIFLKVNKVSKMMKFYFWSKSLKTGVKSDYLIQI